MCQDRDRNNLHSFFTQLRTTDLLTSTPPDHHWWGLPGSTSTSCVWVNKGQGTFSNAQAAHQVNTAGSGTGCKASRCMEVAAARKGLAGLSLVEPVRGAGCERLD